MASTVPSQIGGVVPIDCVLGIRLWDMARSSQIGKTHQNSLPVYGSIELIFSIDGAVKPAARCHKPATVSFDPFAIYPHFPAKLYSSDKADSSY